MSEVGKLLLLGRDYGSYGSMASTRVGAHGAAVISVGSDLDSPSNRFKADPTVTNEDALCAIEAHDWAGFAVADAHYGPESSHLFIERLHNIWATVRPRDLDHLVEMADFLRNGPPATTESETTLLIVVFDRTTNVGFGLSYGDSSFAIVGPNSEPTAINPRDMRFVQTSSRRSMLHGCRFEFEAEPGEVMLTYTDGVDECHYRSPETSVRPSHIAEIAARSDYDPFTIASETTRLALGGVDGYPGGQDNIAFIASQVVAPITINA